MSNLMDYVMIGHLFDEDVCAHYIDEINTNLWSPHEWYKNDTNKRHTLNDFKVTYSKNVQNMMEERVREFANLYFNEFRDGGDPECQFSGVRFNKYEVGESIRPHVDHIHSIFDGEKRGIPVLSFVGVFNDNYKGGDFLLCGEKIELNAGDTVIFPSVFLYPHEVTPVTEGTRYSWVMWSW